MEVDYKRRLELPTIRWTINERDIERRIQEVELSNLYKDAYSAWKGVHENQEFQSFGTAPVRDAYWKITPPEIKQHFDSKLLSKPAPTMIFKRFPRLSVPEDDLDILVKALLGFL